MRTLLTPALSQGSLARELADLSQEVRRIGCGYRSDPETIAIQKDEIARRLSRLARAVERP